MPNSENIKTVEILSQRLKDAKSIVMVDYKGLNVDEADKLRAKMRQANVDYFVAKNTLIRIALNQAGIDTLDDSLHGPTAVAVSKEDEVAPARELRNFIKEVTKDKDYPSFKEGLIDGSFFGKEDIMAISKLPSREQLVGQVLCGINSPLTGLVYTLNGIIAKLAYAIKGIADSK